MSSHHALSQPPDQVSLHGTAASYEEFVDAHAEQFRRYLHRVLDRQAEGRGGCIGVEDTLQDGLLRIYQRWPVLEQLPDEERDRRLYRCLRDAAAKALRDVYGERRRSAPRPRLVAFDFDSLDVDGDDRPSPERELAAAVLGTMVRDVAEVGPAVETRAMVTRAMLVAALRALTGREAVVLIAVDHLGWDQQQLAQRLGIDYVALRQTLFYARQIFYTLVRHATGLEVDEEERAALVAYRAGELTGAQKRSVARHLKHCQACQALDTERRIFGQHAAPVLTPLPFLAGAAALRKGSMTKAAATGVAGPGLLAQPGAAKAAAIVMGILGLGGGTAAVLAAIGDQRSHRATHPAVLSGPAVVVRAPVGMRRTATPAVPARATTSATSAHHRARRANSRPRERSTTVRSTVTASPTTPTAQPTSIPSAPSPAPRDSGSTRPASRGCEFFCG